MENPLISRVFPDQSRFSDLQSSARFGTLRPSFSANFSAKRQLALHRFPICWFSQNPAKSFATDSIGQYYIPSETTVP